MKEQQIHSRKHASVAVIGMVLIATLWASALGWERRHPACNEAGLGHAEQLLDHTQPFAPAALIAGKMPALPGLPAISAAVEQPLMTLILVRHAEKEIVPPENKDPNLSVAGQARAQELRRMFGGAGLTAIYATQYKRTQQTVKPLADKLGIAVTKLDAKETSELVKQIRARPAGQRILIAGHNNTVPEIIAALGGPQMPIIPETEYDNLFVLTVPSEGPAKLLKMKYGSALHPIGDQKMITAP